MVYIDDRKKGKFELRRNAIVLISLKDMQRYSNQNSWLNMMNSLFFIIQSEQERIYQLLTDQLILRRLIHRNRHRTIIFIGKDG